MPKSKILIADDNLTNVELLEAYLADMDCEIAMAVDGRDTLDKVAQFQPDLILLDIMMPKLSGFEVCKTLKKDPATKHIMILMVTALERTGRHRAGRGRGLRRFPEQAGQQAGTAQARGKHAQTPPRDRRTRTAAPLHRRHGRLARAEKKKSINVLQKLQATYPSGIIWQEWK